MGCGLKSTEQCGNCVPIMRWSLCQLHKCTGHWGVKNWCAQEVFLHSYRSPCSMVLYILHGNTCCKGAGSSTSVETMGVYILSKRLAVCRVLLNMVRRGTISGMPLGVVEDSNNGVPGRSVKSGKWLCTAARHLMGRGGVSQGWQGDWGAPHSGLKGF